MVPRLPSQPSKAGCGISEILILAGLIFLLTRFAPLLTALVPVAVSLPAAAQGQSVIPSRIIKVVEFDDRGRTYRVDLDSGSVTFSDGQAPQPEPVPPKPEPPKPEPPKLEGLALRVNEWFAAKVTTKPAETAAALSQCIETALAVSGGLGLKGQQVIDELARQIDDSGLRPALAGFPLGDALKMAVGDDPAKIIPALRDAQRGLRAIQ